MPYISEKDRKYTYLLGPKGPGELNFLFTEAITDYIEKQGLSYQTINDVVGALEGAKLEFYRRVAAPYEDVKIEENGDVY
jgi:predicted DNA-binding protein with PD1-like motif